MAQKFPQYKARFSREKRLEIKIQKLSHTWDNIKGPNMQSPQREERLVETELKPLKK